MTTWERVKRMYEHREADRVPFLDSPWNGTISRWQREGMPVNIDWRDFFGVDKAANINVNISPRYPKKILEETERYTIFTTQWGVTMKEFKEEDSTPEMLEYTINTPEAWEKAKACMTLEDDRIPWEMLKKNYDKWRAEGQWISGTFWFGFDVTHSWMMGLEPVLFAMMDNPEFIQDVFDTYLTHCEVLFQRMWDAGYKLDEILFYDDMGYKGTTFFSPKVYRRILQEFHQRAVSWAHNHGIYARLHSCGDIMKLLPDVLDTGIDALNPLEVKAGMDAFAVKQTYGNRLVLHGGINAANMHDVDYTLTEIEEKVPVLKENGGYILASDHSIPNSVSLDTMRQIVAKARECGSY